MVICCQFSMLSLYIYFFFLYSKDALNYLTELYYSEAAIDSHLFFCIA